MWLPVVLMLRLMLLVVVVWHRVDSASLEIDVHSSGIRLGVVLQAKFLTDLLNSGLDLLNMTRRMIALADNHVKVGLSGLTGISDTLFEDLLCLTKASVHQQESKIEGRQCSTLLTRDQRCLRIEQLQLVA